MFIGAFDDTKYHEGCPSIDKRRNDELEQGREPTEWKKVVETKGHGHGHNYNDGYGGSVLKCSHICQFLEFEESMNMVVKIIKLAFQRHRPLVNPS
ncbi:hypothetical protein OROGR_004202 [Orobanche gracilis]